MKTYTDPKTAADQHKPWCQAITSERGVGPFPCDCKPTGEWTVVTRWENTPKCKSFVLDGSGNEILAAHRSLCEGVAKSLNDALAAAKSGGWLSNEALDEYAKVEQEHRTLVNALKYYARTADNVKVATDALTKVKEGK